MGTAAGGTQRDRHLGCWKGVGTFKDLGLGVSWVLRLFIRLLPVPDGLDHACFGLQSRLGAAKEPPSPLALSGKERVTLYTLYEKSK